MKKRQPLAVSVERHIDAPPELVYDLVSDVTRMGEWSPETVRAEWIGDATHAEPGARFKGSNRLGPNRWSTKPEVLVADRGRRFAFKVPGRSGPTWTYDFRAEGHGTRVIEAVHQTAPSPLPIRLLQRRAGVKDRAGHLASGMAITLERLDAAATAA